MEKIKRIFLGVLLVSLLCLVTACGRNDSQNATTATSSGYGETSGGSMDRTDAPDTGTTEGIRDGESGGVLKDVVDDVKNGIEDAADDVKDDMKDGTAGGRETEGSGSPR